MCRLPCSAVSSWLQSGRGWVKDQHISKAIEVRKCQILRFHMHRPRVWLAPLGHHHDHARLFVPKMYHIARRRAPGKRQFGPRSPPLVPVGGLCASKRLYQCLARIFFLRYSGIFRATRTTEWWNVDVTCGMPPNGTHSTPASGCQGADEGDTCLYTCNDGFVVEVGAEGVIVIYVFIRNPLLDSSSVESWLFQGTEVIKTKEVTCTEYGFWSEAIVCESLRRGVNITSWSHYTNNHQPILFQYWCDLKQNRHHVKRSIRQPTPQRRARASWPMAMSAKCSAKLVCV